jgi:hypothetical protein
MSFWTIIGCIVVAAGVGWIVWSVWLRVWINGLLRP